MFYLEIKVDQTVLNSLIKIILAVLIHNLNLKLGLSSLDNFLY